MILRALRDLRDLVLDLLVGGNPVSQYTDAFDFGLGICGVGRYSASSQESWYLKVNHENPEIGGELVKLKPGDEVLWALAKFPYPKELALVAPAEATARVPFDVRVLSYPVRTPPHWARAYRAGGVPTMIGSLRWWIRLIVVTNSVRCPLA